MGPLLQRLVPQVVRRVVGQVHRLLLQVRAVQQQGRLRGRDEAVRHLRSGEGRLLGDGQLRRRL